MNLDTKVELLKALADPIRLKIVQRVWWDAQPVATCELARECSQPLNLSQPTLSHHLAKLVQAGILCEQKSARQKSYQVNKPLLVELGIDVHTLTKEKEQ